LDENYQTYLNRAMRLILPETYQTQVQYIQESPKFRPDPDRGRQPVPFPGYTIVTPPGSKDSKNVRLYESLKYYQQQLVHKLGPKLFAPVPPETFHLTLADLIWDSVFRAANEENPDFETKLHQCVANIFEQCQPLTEENPIEFQALGLMVMTRAIALCLVPTDDYSYERILKFRRALYQNHDLMGLGIEQQYYFTPHITLGYFGTIPPVEDLPVLSNHFIELNQQWLDEETQEFWVHRAELQKFDDMTHYYREPDWAMFEF
jgi:2'-5' RNA ligase